MRRLLLLPAALRNAWLEPENVGTGGDQVEKTMTRDFFFAGQSRREAKRGI
jgi:hypothetical protein